MRLKNVFVATVSLVALGTSSIAGAPGKATPAACNMFPANNQRFAIRPGTGQIPEMIFRQYLQAVAQIYAPLFAKAGLPSLRAIPFWENDEVNAQAWPSLEDGPGGVKLRYSNIRIFGGLARHPMMTGDGLVLVICHEIGHHLGGFPRYTNSGWPGSTEGQSDYFATAKCAREVFGRLTDNDAWYARSTITMDVRNSCQQSFPQNRLQAIVCMRSSMAGLVLARVLNSVASVPAQIDFATRDRSAVPVTYESHPKAQCRLDTYVAGALCQAPASTAFSPTEARQGACTPDQRMTRGFRPSCWFAPKSAQEPPFLASRSF